MQYTSLTEKWDDRMIEKTAKIDSKMKQGQCWQRARSTRCSQPTQRKRKNRENEGINFSQDERKIKMLKVRETRKANMVETENFKKGIMWHLLFVFWFTTFFRRSYPTSFHPDYISFFTWTLCIRSYFWTKLML